MLRILIAAEKLATLPVRPEDTRSALYEVVTEACGLAYSAGLTEAEIERAVMEAIRK